MTTVISVPSVIGTYSECFLKRSNAGVEPEYRIGNWAD